VKIAVLGAGLTGLTTAILLQKEGFEVDVYEKESIPGGLARSRIIDGYVFDLHGGHVYNSKIPGLNDWVFSRLKQDQWKLQPRIAKILYKNMIIDYPFELSLKQLPIKEAITCIKDLCAPRGQEPDNFHDWLIWNFGRAIAERYMLPYNQKIWSYDLRQLGIYWVKGKMPLVTLDEVLQAVLTGAAEEKAMPHANFYYPLQGGIQTFVNALASEVDNLILNTNINAVQKVDRHWIINGQAKYDFVISTLPLKELISIMKKQLPAKIKQALEALKHNSLTVTLVESFAENDYSWLYIPDKEYRTHRLVFQGNLSPNNCPTEHNSLTLESIGQWEPEEQANELRQKSWPSELKIGRIIASEYVKYAYIIFDQQTPANLEIIFDYFKELAFKSIGRFGEWQYYNMDVSMSRAFTIVKEMVK